MRLYCLGVLTANTDNPYVQEAFQVWRTEENILVIFDQASAKPEKDESNLRVILKLIEIYQNIVDSMRRNMVEGLLEYRFIVPVRSVCLQAKLNGINEARQMIL